MENTDRVKPLITSEGLVLEVSTGVISNSDTSYMKNNSHENFYTNIRVNSELSNIAKYERLPDSLLELSKICYEFYSQKYSAHTQEQTSHNSLRKLLRLLPNFSCLATKHSSLKALFSSH